MDSDEELERLEPHGNDKSNAKADAQKELDPFDEYEAMQKAASQKRSPLLQVAHSVLARSLGRDSPAAAHGRSALVAALGMPSDGQADIFDFSSAEPVPDEEAADPPIDFAAMGINMDEVNRSLVEEEAKGANGARGADLLSWVSDAQPDLLGEDGELNEEALNKFGLGQGHAQLDGSSLDASFADDAYEHEELVGSTSAQQRDAVFWSRVASGKASQWADNHWWSGFYQRRRWRYAIGCCTVLVIVLIALVALPDTLDEQFDPQPNAEPNLEDRWRDVVALYSNSTLAAVQVAVRLLRPAVPCNESGLPDLVLMEHGLEADQSYYGALKAFIADAQVVITGEEGSSVFTNAPLDHLFTSVEITKYRLAVLSSLVELYRLQFGRLPISLDDLLQQRIDEQESPVADLMQPIDNASLWRWSAQLLGVGWASGPWMMHGTEPPHVQLRTDAWKQHFVFEQKEAMLRSLSEEMSSWTSTDPQLASMGTKLWLSQFAAQRLAVSVQSVRSLFDGNDTALIRGDSSSTRIPNHFVLPTVPEHEQPVTLAREFYEFWAEVTHEVVSRHALDSEPRSNERAVAMAKLALFFFLEQTLFDPLNMVVDVSERTERARDRDLINTLMCITSHGGRQCNVNASLPEELSCDKPIVLAVSSTRIKHVEREIITRTRRTGAYARSTPCSTTLDCPAGSPWLLTETRLGAADADDREGLVWLTKWKTGLLAGVLRADDVDFMREKARRLVRAPDQFGSLAF